MSVDRHALLQELILRYRFALVTIIAIQSLVRKCNKLDIVNTTISDAKRTNVPETRTGQCERSRDNHLMIRRRYISFEKLIWRELGEFPPKDARREHSLVEYWEVFEANDWLRSWSARFQKKTRETFRRRETSSGSPPLFSTRLSSSSSSSYLLATGTVLSRNNDSRGFSRSHWLALNSRSGLKRGQLVVTSSAQRNKM